MHSLPMRWSNCKRCWWISGYCWKVAHHSIVFASIWRAVANGHSLVQPYSKRSHGIPIKRLRGWPSPKTVSMCWSCPRWHRWHDILTVLWWHLVAAKTTLWLWLVPKTPLHRTPIKNYCSHWVNRKFWKLRCSLPTTWMHWVTHARVHRKWIHSPAMAAIEAYGKWNKVSIWRFFFLE